MIRIAQAARPESGKGKWGMPPNQLRTGATAANPGGNMDGELEVRAFYGGWEIVFRPISSNMGDRIARIMEEAVRNGAYIGYGQNNGKYPRTGVFDALKKLPTPEPMQIKTLCNCDCSSLVGAAVYFSGVRMSALRDMYTGNQRDIFRTSGDFVEIFDKPLLQSGQGVKRGDIFWKPGHTAVALDTDKTQEVTPCKICNCSACNLREGAGTNNKIVKVLHSGDIVELISTASNGWGQVRDGKFYGYVSPMYYRILDTKTATGNVWLRNGAGTGYLAIIVIPLGAKVYVTGQTKKVGLTTWYEVFYAGKRGWASGKYLR